MKFFGSDENYDKGWDWYVEQFDAAGDEPVWGEATPNYFWVRRSDAEKTLEPYCEDIPKRVKTHLPDAKIIVSLRDPVERGISAFRHHIRSRALSLRSRLRDHLDEYGIVSIGRYAEQLTAWRDVFPSDRFLIFVYEEDIAPDAQKPRTIARCFEHIGVEPHTVESLYERKYPGASGMELWLNQLRFFRHHWRGRRFIKVINRLTPRAIDKTLDVRVTQDDRDALRERLAPDVKALEEMLGRKLPWADTWDAGAT